MASMEVGRRTQPYRHPGHGRPGQPGTDLAVLADLARVVGANWRTDLATTLAGVRNRQDRAVSGPLTGQVWPRTLRLPSRLELRGDTTIVAHDVVLEDSHVSIVANGHTLRLLPIDKLHTQLTATTGTGGRAAVASTIRFEANGQDGMAGQSGDVGDTGAAGEAGEGGETVFDPSSGCFIGKEGKAGKQGGTGGAGTGTGGTRSHRRRQPAHRHTRRIHRPVRADRPRRARRGRRSGRPGRYRRQRGPGGTGGWGECRSRHRRRSGWPGWPRRQRRYRRQRRSGGDGGNGGDITVSYPEAYDSSLIFTGPSGAGRVAADRAARPASAGRGGDGGQGGHGNNGDGNPGSPARRASSYARPVRHVERPRGHQRRGHPDRARAR
jgi:hypothetical protein